MVDLLGLPDRVFVQHEDRPVSATRSGDRWTTVDAEVAVGDGGGGFAVSLHCPRRAVSRIVLRWERSFTAQTLFLGDAWERGYGDLQWRHLQAERIMPWYFSAHDPHGKRTIVWAVKTGPDAMCF